MELKLINQINEQESVWNWRPYSNAVGETARESAHSGDEQKERQSNDSQAILSFPLNGK